MAALTTVILFGSVVVLTAVTSTTSGLEFSGLMTAKNGTVGRDAVS